MAGALCQVCTSLQRHLHQSRVAGGSEPRQAALIRLRWRYARCGSRMVPGVPGDAIWGGAASATQLEVRFHRGRSEQPLAADASPRPVRVPVAPSGLLPTPIPATPVRRIGVQGL